MRFQELLAPGARIYHETHYAPLLHMQGEVRGIAVEIVHADGGRLPALVNSVLRHDAEGRPQVIRTTIFDASDRRRYEQELLRARRREQEIARELQRGMLSGALPEADGLEVDVAYRPGVAGLEVGGDWYDASGSTTARRSASSSATSSAAGSARPPRWGSCAAPCAPSRRPAWSRGASSTRSTRTRAGMRSAG